MKRLSIIFLISAMSIIYADAQFYVGGGFSFNHTGGNTEFNGTTTDKDKINSFSLSPIVGYIYTEKIYFGIVANLSISSMEEQTQPDVTKTTSSSIGAYPFIRYYALNVNKFSAFIQGQAGISIANSKEKVGGTTTDGPSSNTLSLSAFPGLAYDLNENVQLYTNIGLLNFGISRIATKQEIAGETEYDRDIIFGFGVNMNNIVTVGNITVGAIYKF